MRCPAGFSRDPLPPPPAAAPCTAAALIPASAHFPAPASALALGASLSPAPCADPALDSAPSAAWPPRRRPRPRLIARGGTHPDRGSATVESAILIPAIVLVALLVVMAAGAASAKISCEHAAGAATRVLARGGTDDHAAREAQQIAGPHARVRVAVQDGLASTHVERDAPWLLGSWGGLALEGEATTLSEEAVVGRG